MPVSASFRFYQELNDFLKKPYRKHRFVITFNGTTTVKDAIESLGVPHTEVDMITVNGSPVNFTYRIQDNDDIAVYPVFESFDISETQLLREQVKREPKFILDVHLGKLVKYLRMAGFDCLYDVSLVDKQIIDISILHQRIILTRDKGILKNGRVTHGMFVRATTPTQQFREVISRLQLERFVKPFTRCTACNEPISQVEKKEISDQLLPLTRKHYTEFFRCTGCNKIYWEGSHYKRMKQLMDSILNK